MCPRSLKSTLLGGGFSFFGRSKFYFWLCEISNTSFIMELFCPEKQVSVGNQLYFSTETFEVNYQFKHIFSIRGRNVSVSPK